MQVLSTSTGTAPPVTPLRPRATAIRRAKYVLGAADSAAIAIAIGVALRATNLETAEEGSASPWLVVAAAPVVWVGALARYRLYSSRHLTRRLEEFRRIVWSCATALAALAFCAYTADAAVSRAWLLTVAVAAVVVLTAEREIARRVFLRLRRAGRMRRAVVVVGGNTEALELAHLMDSDRSLGYEAIGFVTDTPPELLADDVRYRCLGPIDAICEIVESSGAVGVVIASTAVTTTTSNHLVRVMTRAGVHVELSSTLRDVASERLTISGLGRFPMLYVEPVRRTGWRIVAKRVFDMVVAATMLLATAPAVVLIAVAVKITSPGPVLFRQWRVGKDGVLFQLFKFRTMVDGAESLLIDLTDRNEADGPLFKIRDDPRVTRIGNFLRRSSIDEIPQLWNVLRGEMSLVGPRPALPEETARWTPELHNRLDVKPGITGMWQVNGRSNASFDEYVRLDLFYVDNWSLITDLAILARTVPAVLLRKGAM